MLTFYRIHLLVYRSHIMVQCLMEYCCAHVAVTHATRNTHTGVDLNIYVI